MEKHNNLKHMAMGSVGNEANKKGKPLTNHSSVYPKQRGNKIKQKHKGGRKMKNIQTKVNNITTSLN